MSRYFNADTFFETFGELNIEPYNNFPTADVVEVVHGEWCIAEDVPKLDNTFSIECSICGQLMLAHHNENYPNFCCNCGANMRGGKQ